MVNIAIFVSYARHSPNELWFCGLVSALAYRNSGYFSRFPTHLRLPTPNPGRFRQGACRKLGIQPWEGVWRLLVISPTKLRHFSFFSRRRMFFWTENAKKNPFLLSKVYFHVTIFAVQGVVCNFAGHFLRFSNFFYRLRWWCNVLCRALADTRPELSTSLIL